MATTRKKVFEISDSFYSEDFPKLAQKCKNKTPTVKLNGWERQFLEERATVITLKNTKPGQKFEYSIDPNDVVEEEWYDYKFQCMPKYSVLINMNEKDIVNFITQESETKTSSIALNGNGAALCDANDKYEIEIGYRSDPNPRDFYFLCVRVYYAHFLPADSGRVLRLNIGGVQFSLSAGVIEMIFPQSLFAQIISNTDFQWDRDENDIVVFQDRNPEIFQDIILYYMLRDTDMVGNQTLKKYDPQELDQEFKFWCLASPVDSKYNVANRKRFTNTELGLVRDLTEKLYLEEHHRFSVRKRYNQILNIIYDGDVDDGICLPVFCEHVYGKKFSYDARYSNVWDQQRKKYIHSTCILKDGDKEFCEEIVEQFQETHWVAIICLTLERTEQGKYVPSTNEPKTEVYLLNQSGATISEQELFKCMEKPSTQLAIDDADIAVFGSHGDYLKRDTRSLHKVSLLMVYPKPRE